MGFDPWNLFLKFKIPLGPQLPKWELIWECGGSFPHILSHSREHDMWLHSWPAPSQALALVTNLRLGLRHKVFFNWYNHYFRGNNFIVEYWNVKDQNQRRIWTITRDIRSRSNKNSVFNNKMKRFLCQTRDIAWR